MGSISDPGQLIFNGHVNEKAKCYSCHNGDGTGTWKGKNLIGITNRHSKEEIIKAIQEGPGMMPSFKEDLTEEEIQKIYKWLDSLNEEKSAPNKSLKGTP